MVYSMTGFATTTYELHPAPGVTLHATMTIKTLNSRFFEIICRLPHALAAFEQPIMQRCKEILKRGTVTVTIHLNNPSALRTEVVPALNVAAGYVQAIREIQKTCAIPGELHIGDILALPHLFESSDATISDAMRTEIMHHVSDLLALVMKTRALEGASLQKDLEASMALVGTCIEQLAPRAEEISHQRRERFLQELTTALAHVTQDVRDIHIQALYQHINAIDTHEEVVRLRTHHENFLATLHDQDTLKGKKLDFILQELSREINTLNSKLADSASINAILTVKTKLEHAREQTLNIL